MIVLNVTEWLMRVGSIDTWQVTLRVTLIPGCRDILMTSIKMTNLAWCDQARQEVSQLRIINQKLGGFTARYNSNLYQQSMWEKWVLAPEEEDDARVQDDYLMDKIEIILKRIKCISWFLNIFIHDLYKSTDLKYIEKLLSQYFIMHARLQENIWKKLF